MALLNFRAGQGVLEHAAKDMVTICAITGRIEFDRNKTPAELGSARYSYSIFYHPSEDWTRF